MWSPCECGGLGGSAKRREVGGAGAPGAHRQGAQSPSFLPSGAFALLYLVEAIAVVSIIKRHPGDAAAAVRERERGWFRRTADVATRARSRPTQCASPLFLCPLQAREVREQVTLGKKMLPFRLQVGGEGGRRGGEGEVGK